MLRAAQYIGADIERKTTVFEFEVADFMCNKDGVLHGGAASILFDNISSPSLFTIGSQLVAIYLISSCYSGSNQSTAGQHSGQCREKDGDGARCYALTYREGMRELGA
ncbi:hypothetical protein BBP40_009086 [Aspergillus hancockii]|nr:hypothetical protein BBP40_009086 [Aspergillus hancockii]